MYKILSEVTLHAIPQTPSQSATHTAAKHLIEGQQQLLKFLPDKTYVEEVNRTIQDAQDLEGFLLKEYETPNPYGGWSKETRTENILQRIGIGAPQYEPFLTGLLYPLANDTNLADYIYPDNLKGKIGTIFPIRIIIENDIPKLETYVYSYHELTTVEQEEPVYYMNGQLSDGWGENGTNIGIHSTHTYYKKDFRDHSQRLDQYFIADMIAKAREHTASSVEHIDWTNDTYKDILDLYSETTPLVDVSLSFGYQNTEISEVE